jgi:hypothetical protein
MTAINTAAAGTLMFALPVGAGFGVEGGKSGLVTNMVLVPSAAALIQSTTGLFWEGFVAKFTREEKAILEACQGVYGGLGSFAVYLGLFLTRQWHLTLIK